MSVPDYAEDDPTWSAEKARLSRLLNRTES
jgi:hypothetical protein